MAASAPWQDRGDMVVERSRALVVTWGSGGNLPPLLAALAAGEAAGVPTASLVHFPYALARSVMARGGGAWTTDRATLDATRRELGLPASTGDVEAWESPELLLVTLPRWFDAPGELPDHVVHAGPLGVRTGGAAAGRRALLAFSTTVMEH